MCYVCSDPLFGKNQIPNEARLMGTIARNERKIRGYKPVDA